MKMVEKYLKYPLKVEYGVFKVLIVQEKRDFIAKLMYSGDDAFQIRHSKHGTIHLAILWANDELSYIVKLNDTTTEPE